MKKICSLFLMLAALGGCTAGPTPYQATSRPLPDKDEFEIKMKGDPGISGDQLRGFLIAQGDSVCGKRIFRLRHIREDDFGAYNTLRAEIECM